MTGPSKPARVAVLISGRGSNMEALIEACATPGFPATLVSVVSNRPEAPGLAKARAAGLSTTVIDHRAHADRPAFEEALHAHLVDVGAELVCLAGFMRLLTAGFVERWQDRMLNIHPSLLPSFKGLHTHERALEAGVRVHGCTVHLVRPDMDNGPILAQAALAIAPDDTPDSLAARVLTLEHRIYPLALRLMAEGRVRVVDGRALVDGAASPATTLINPRDEA
ncbi:phosphoribosylglycinamide formyltransferase [Pararhodospirillum oryzae]|uniref:Phosphoribosylglycinamide formyltransferase n=1 Tax=Pararhodospirillum oryzae TaxID=478448 RepID=A0A512H3H6_9PROT|nr:phosphoribosylglycinamide formyltransferase [Pararhodospirillum oryzae]GEO79997.1 phosphoribosylglycinamide formyltransferase [Pararhodospirillum oryzae]